MESEDDSSETETQFVEHPDDATSMWTVIEILDERPHEFLIKWAGLDSEGKPWADSWEPKGNVTNDVVHAWREEHPRVSSSICELVLL
ncbi:hypothetical protein BDP27DRAFT_1328033 [Rhodocollybia butyracea]|uniref:Chromo domain-containing protein n=1 Tax=Rhodocollybia butyracea TaxID=206335 RepID=A0A9P5PSY6_9AGAR|nr:hypothetical protein BDP27DRAFT_1328033 [Rhodocollybia butyracea]